MAWGDQVWSGIRLNSLAYIDNKFPNLKKNLKVHLSELSDVKIEMPLENCDIVKLADCGGGLKLHLLEILPYIENEIFSLFAVNKIISVLMGYKILSAFH